MGKQKEPFSIRKRVKSVEYAFNGLVLLCKNEHNARIHLAVFALVVIFGWYFHISPNEWVSIIIVSGMVLLSEGFNTAIEYLVDHISPEYHEVMGQVKDIAAGAVLIAAMAAVITGSFIFGPRFWHWNLLGL